MKKTQKRFERIIIIIGGNFPLRSKWSQKKKKNPFVTFTQRSMQNIVKERMKIPDRRQTLALMKCSFARLNRRTVRFMFRLDLATHIIYVWCRKNEKEKKRVLEVMSTISLIF